MVVVKKQTISLIQGRFNSKNCKVKINACDYFKISRNVTFLKIVYREKVDKFLPLLLCFHEKIFLCSCEVTKNKIEFFLSYKLYVGSDK